MNQIIKMKDSDFETHMDDATYEEFTNCLSCLDGHFSDPEQLDRLQAELMNHFSTLRQLRVDGKSVRFIRVVPEESSQDELVWEIELIHPDRLCHCGSGQPWVDCTGIPNSTYSYCG